MRINAHPRQDVSTNAVNPNHPGNGQSARLGIPGHDISVRSTEIYDGMGNAMGVVRPTQFGNGKRGGLNAGEITKLVLTPGGKPVPCVYAWNVATHKGAASGWIPLSSIKQTKVVGREESAIAQRIAQIRGSDQFDHHQVRRVVPKTAEQAGVGSLYTFPNQHSPVANKADYFFSRGGESTVFLNLPKKGDSGRFGIAADIVPKGAAFHVDTSVHAQNRPLYRLGQSTPEGNIKFVYGYFLNDAGQKRHGWINSALIPR